VRAFSLTFSIAPSGETTGRIKKVRGCKNGTDHLYHHAKYGGDPGSRAGCRRKSVLFYPQACRYWFYSVVQKWVFVPQGRQVAPINVKFDTGKRGPKVRSLVPNFTSGQKCWNTAPKLSKFPILAINLPLRGHSFAQFLTKFSDFVRVSSWILSF